MSSWNATWAGPYDETLKELYRKGRTSSEIADAVNRKHRTSFSKNAVIGRVHRLGLNKKPKRLKKEQKAKRPQTNRANAMNTVLKIQRAAGPKIKREPFKARDADVVSRRVPIIDLQAMECRWPDAGGDPLKGITHTFCGNRTADGSSYCPAHARLAWGQGTPSERSAVRNAQSIARAA